MTAAKSSSQSESDRSGRRSPCSIFTMRPLRVSLSGAGFLGAWHLGACEALHRAGMLTEASSCEIAGASAGAIVGAVVASGTPISVARDHLARMAESCRAHPLGILTPGFSLVQLIRDALAADLPSDAHQRASGRLHVALTSLREGVVGHVRHQTRFASRDELIDAVASSSDIPGLTARLRQAHGDKYVAAVLGHAAASGSEETSGRTQSVARLLRWLRRRDIDGGLLDLFPDPWATVSSADDWPEVVPALTLTLTLTHTWHPLRRRCTPTQGSLFVSPFCLYHS